MTMIDYSWSGHDVNGVYRYGGQAMRSPMQLVASYWPRGWQDLEVRDPEGELVAYIETDKKGTRNYWVRDQEKQDQHRKGKRS